MTVAVLIVNWNSRHLLRDCLRSLSAQTRPPDRVIVVELYPRSDELVSTQKMIKSVVLPDRGNAWTGSRRRYFGLADVLGVYGSSEQDDDLSAVVARAVGRRLMVENNARAAVATGTVGAISA